MDATATEGQPKSKTNEPHHLSRANGYRNKVAEEHVDWRNRPVSRGTLLKGMGLAALGTVGILKGPNIINMLASKKPDQPSVTGAPRAPEVTKLPEYIIEDINCLMRS